MTSKEALETISELHFCGQDLCTKEWYESGIVSDTYDEEIKCIQRDLELLKILLRYGSDKYIIGNLPNNDYDALRIKELTGGEYE